MPRRPGAAAAHQADERHAHAVGAVVEQALIEDGEQRVQDGAVRLEDLVNERDAGRRQVALRLARRRCMSGSWHSARARVREPGTSRRSVRAGSSRSHGRRSLARKPQAWPDTLLQGRAGQAARVAVTAQAESRAACWRCRGTPAARAGSPGARSGRSPARACSAARTAPRAPRSA